MADFVRAIIHPKIAFKGLRQDLIDGNPVLDLQGKPCNARGGFGCVIKYETFCPKKVWAIKCYNVLPPGLEDHYLEIIKYLEASPVNRYFLEISFSKAGIKVGGKVYPILKMEWSDGVDLHHYISKNINAPNKLKMLAEEWLKVCSHLTIHGVAHGDIQHGNVHVCENNGRIAIKIIDYDSLFFTASGSIHKDIIKGMEGYQHPKRRDLAYRCIQPDYFSHLVIYLSILAIAEDSNLWKLLDLDNKEHLLFTLKDFENPLQSQIFSNLKSNFSQDIKLLTNSLIDFCLMQDVNRILPLKGLLPTTPSASLNTPQLPKGIYSVRTESKVNISLPLISIPTKKNGRSPGVFKTRNDNLDLQSNPKPLKLEAHPPALPSPLNSSQAPTLATSSLSQNQSSPTIHIHQTQTRQSVKPHTNSPFSSKMASRISNLTINILTIAVILFPFYCFGFVISNIWDAFPLKHILIDNADQEIVVYQKGNILPLKIRLKKYVIRELEKKSSMLFWVEYPKHQSLYKSKQGIYVVKESLKLWKYTGKSKINTEDCIGTVTSANLVPYEGYGHFQPHPSQKAKAWLIKVSFEKPI